MTALGENSTRPGGADRTEGTLGAAVESVSESSRPGRRSQADAVGDLAGIDPGSIHDAAFRRAVVGMAVVDAEGSYLEVNDALCSFLGYFPEELLAMSFSDVIAPDDVSGAAKAMRAVGEGRSSEFSVKKQYVTRSGEHVWARTTGIAVHDPSGVLLRIIVQVEDLTFQHESEVLLDRRASLDELTNLSNRATFFARFDAALELPQPSTSNLALLLVNLDRFNQVNAGLGTASGDTILREVARRLTAMVRGEDVVARLGGNEFAILSFAMRTPLDAVSLAIEIRQALGRPYWCDGNAVYVSARVGVVTNLEGSDSQTLVQMATAATLQAKGLSGGWALHTEGADTSSRDELGLVTDLREAIADGKLTVAYQPVVDNRGAVRYVEALARWDHPDRGSIPPDQFIVLAERNGLIDALTTLVMTTAVRQIATWRAIGIDTCVAVNLSGQLLAEPDLADRVATILHDAGVPGTMLILEITETAIAEGSNPMIWDALSAVRATGVRISIDDFGTGYSSLSYLKDLPVDELKIDRSFILDLDTDDRTERIVRSIIDLAHSLNLSVVAEGVEHSTVAARLRSLGIDSIQGYAIGRPATATAMTEWLRHRPMAVATTVAQDARRGLDVLIVDSRPSERTALRQRLRKGKHRVAQARSSDTLLKRVKKRMPDVVILDHLMPGLSGVATAPQLRSAGYLGPIVILSGSAPDTAEAAKYPLDVWPLSYADESLLIRLIDGYAGAPAPSDAFGDPVW